MPVDSEQRPMALKQATTFAFDSAVRARCGTVFVRQVADLGIEIGLFAAGEFPKLFELVEIKLRPVQVWPQFGDAGQDEEGDQREKTQRAVCLQNQRYHPNFLHAPRH